MHVGGQRYDPVCVCLCVCVCVYVCVLEGKRVCGCFGGVKGGLPYVLCE